LTSWTTFDIQYLSLCSDFSHVQYLQDIYYIYIYIYIVCLLSKYALDPLIVIRPDINLLFKMEVDRFTCITKVRLMVFNATFFQQYFSYIVVVSLIGGGNRITQRKSLTCITRKMVDHVLYVDVKSVKKVEISNYFTNWNKIFMSSTKVI
jgi:hypothetical protein